jgi:hypothetical protein
MMTESELVAAVRDRISDPQLRVEITTAGTAAIFKPATSAALDKADQELGYPIPPLLRRLYQEVGNGGFGPGCGFLGVAGGYMDDDGRTLTSFYVEIRSQGWPEGILNLCDMGCGDWVSIDGHALDGHILVTQELGITRTEFTLPTLLEAWVKGVDLQSALFEIEDVILRTPEAETVKSRGRGKGVLITAISR